MIWRDRWFQVFIVTKPWNKDATALKYLIGQVDTKTKNAIKMACRVDINDSMTGVAANATVSISGLSARTLYMLSSEMARYIQFPQYSYIELNAGYSNCHGVIYRGSIMEAVPDMTSPDYKITMKCTGLADIDNSAPISTSYAGRVDVRLVLKDIAKQAGMTFVDKTRNKLLNYYVDNVCCNNLSITQLCCLLQQQNRNFGIYLEKGNKTKFSGSHVLIDQDLSAGNIVLYDADTQKIVDGTLYNKVVKIDSRWIVGAPIITELGCTLTIRFRPDIVGLDVVEIHSARYPELATRKFIVSNIRTQLDTKGSTWYKVLTLVYPGCSLFGKPSIYGGGV